MSQQVLTLPVLRVQQPIGEFFVASIKPADLVAISFADVRRLVQDRRDVERYLGIQRPLSSKRVSEIKQYVTSPDATFPTSVIVAIDERCAEYKSNGDGSIGELTLAAFVPEHGSEDRDPIPFNRIAKVLDGQHRIAAFIDEQDNFAFVGPEGPFEINLAIFIGADVSEQANIFATVNLAQTKVNKSLVYDLTELADTRSPHKTCHNVAVALDAEPSSPFFKRIKRLGTATPGRHYEPITQAGFVESLVKFVSRDPMADRNKMLEGKSLRRASVDELRETPFRNLFISNKEVDIVEIIYNYFSAVREKWPQSWGAAKESRNLLPKSNAFKAFMIYLREDVYPQLVGDEVGRVPKVKEFSPFFRRVVLSDRDFTSQNFVPGSGGQASFLKMLRGQLMRDDLIRD